MVLIDFEFECVWIKPPEFPLVEFQSKSMKLLSCLEIPSFVLCFQLFESLAISKPAQPMNHVFVFRYHRSRRKIFGTENLED